MEEFPKNNSEQGGENTLSPELQGLADMAGKIGENTETEQVENTEKEPIAEKYYEQAREERARWLERAEEEMKKAEELKPDDLKVYTNLKAVVEEGKGPEYRPLDMDNPSDIKAFEGYKADEVKKAKKILRAINEDDSYSLDSVAEKFLNREMIDRISSRLKNNEDLDNEENKYLDKLREQRVENPEYTFGIGFEKPETIERRLFQGGYLIGATFFDDLLKPENFDRTMSILWRACLKEDEKQGRVILHKNEEIQSSLENMEERREANPFAGETNINSETGEARTFTPEDNYPRLEGESDEDWANRLKRIQLKTRLAEKRQEQE